MLNRLRFLSIIIFVGISGILGSSNGFASEPPPADEAVGSVSVRLYQVEGSLPADDPKQRQPDISLAKKYLNDWEPQVPLREGLKKTIDHFAETLGLDKKIGF